MNSRRRKSFKGRGEEFQVLFDNIPAYVVVVDPSYRVVKANRHFKNTFGDQTGSPCYQAYKGLQEKCRKCPVERTFLQGTVQVGEQVGRSKDGQDVYYLVYSAPIHDRRGNIQYAMEMSIDLTERKKLERTLQANQDFLNNLIDNSFSGVVALDSGGRIIVFNRAAEYIFGYRTSEVIGNTEVERFFSKKVFPKILSILEGKAGKATLPSSPQETWLRSKDGSKIPVRFSAVPLFRKGSSLGAVGFFEDLRPIKALEREKMQAEKLAAVGQTVAGLAHGIKNIVTGLEGGVYLVQSAMEKKDDALLHQGWEMVERNIGKVSNLVKDLLNYSRSRVPELKWVLPQDLLEEVCSLFREKASQQGVQISIESDPRVGLAFLDPKGVHSCLTNLLANALDACVSEPEKEHHHIAVRTRKGPNDAVIFEVEDDGPGMPVAIREKLFTTFFSTKGTSGTGLGLLVTEKIVQEHGGSIGVETEHKRGSLFRITLPQEEPSPPSAEQTRAGT